MTTMKNLASLGITGLIGILSIPQPSFYNTSKGVNNVKYKDIKDQFKGYSASVAITMTSSSNKVISIALDDLEVDYIDEHRKCIVLVEP